MAPYAFGIAAASCCTCSTDNGTRVLLLTPRFGNVISAHGDLRISSSATAERITAANAR